MEAEEKAVIPLMVLVVGMVLFMHATVVHASPVVKNISISPANPWVGWDVGITAECNDASNNITSVYANVSGPQMSFSNIPLNHLSGETYGLSLLGNDLSGTGVYDVNVGCVNDAGEESRDSGTFRVSVLAGDITKVVDVLGFGSNGIVYAGEYFDAYFLVKKDGSPITAGVGYGLVLNNGAKSIQEPIPYIIGEGHRLRAMAPDSSGSYMLEITADYQGYQVTDTMQIDVMDLLTLELLSIDKSSISTIAPIIINIRATERGSPITIREQDLSIAVGSTNAGIDSISQSGSSYDVEFTPPNLSPGKYKLRVVFDHNGNTRTAERDIVYTIPVSGEISQNGKGLNVAISFDDENGVTTKFATDGSGLYDGAISPGTYDVILEHSDCKITFYDVVVDYFDDPIKYNSLGTKALPGINNAGLFAIETALAYSSATIEMSYHEKSVEGPESDLEVYRCSDWNGDECYTAWEEVDSDIDTVRNIAVVDTNSMSAYSVGTREGISIETGIDKVEYNLYETLLLDGIVTFGDNEKLPDATITANIKGTSITKTTETNSEGIFSLDMTVPEAEGDYDIEVTVDKEPFSRVTATESFSVVKSTGISINIPSGIKMEAMQNKAVEFSVKNDGQLALTGVSISIEDIPDNVAAILDTEGTDEISPQEEFSLLVDFTSLDNATKTHTMRIVVVSNEGVSAEKTIALTTERRNSGIQSGGISTGAANDNISTTLDFTLIGNVIAGVGSGAGYLLAILVGSFSVAIIMRKKRLSRFMEREWVKHKLSSMRLEIAKPKIGGAEYSDNTETNNPTMADRYDSHKNDSAAGGGRVYGEMSGATPLESIAYSMEEPRRPRSGRRSLSKAKGRKARKRTRTSVGAGKKNKRNKQKK
jgi:hypothetical protein